MNRIYFIFIPILLFSNCARKPAGTFQATDLPPAPDYSQAKYWAALPDREDMADVLLDPSLEDEQATAKADVFFLHPTTYSGKRGERNWNAPIDDVELNERTDGSTIKYQASAFNAAGKIYAPRYRQIQLQVFDEFNTEKRPSALAATQVAYSDVKAAFEYYLEHYNQGRPIIIAAHSQGTMMAKELLKDYFDGRALQQQLVAAYLVGIIVPQGFFQNIEPCQSDSDTGCFVTWRTFQKDHVPKNKLLGDTIIVTNPLSWKMDDSYAPAALNKGIIIDDKNGIFKSIADAQISAEHGLLWMTRPKSPTRLRFFPSKNFHIGDINLYYMNVRENAVHRVENFGQE